MTAYYNEWEPYVAEWLRNLIKEGLIADGDVDERSIAAVEPSDLRGYTQCHFFAGIGGWSYALRLAGFPDDRHVWTGSCPCQDFSLAGKREGIGADRDLWPAWLRLISECAPDCVFGEQIADAPEWTDRAVLDMESLGYRFGPLEVPAVAINASHRRYRLWFVADTVCERREGRTEGRGVRAPQGARERREAQRIPTAASAFPHEREWALSGQAGRVGWEEQISWNGTWEVAPEPFVCRGHHGIPARRNQLRALGNAIVPQVAAEFIAAYMECE